MTTTTVAPAARANAARILLQELACDRLRLILGVGYEHNLPSLDWKLARGGVGLVGSIHHRDHADPRTTHLAWADALGLTRMGAQPGYLTATARLGGVQVTLATTLKTTPKEASA